MDTCGGVYRAGPVRVYTRHTHTPHFVDASKLLPQLGKAAENKPIEEAGVLTRSRC